MSKNEGHDSNSTLNTNDTNLICEKARITLLDKSVDISFRIRALFTLRMYPDTQNVQTIHETLINEPYDSILLKHEMAYVLGQMRNAISIPLLFEISMDIEKKYDPITRHESIEALGNFNHSDLYAYNDRFMCIFDELHNDPEIIVVESAYLAKRNILLNKDSPMKSPFGTYDPAPAPDSNFNDANLEKMRKIFLDDSACLFERYKILFLLRNLNNKESISILAEGFSSKSDLLKHEIGFVFGQMANPLSTDILERISTDTSISAIVRHECAEALGSIGDERSMSVLERLVNDKSKVVRDSAVVGLDIREGFCEA